MRLRVAMLPPAAPQPYPTTRPGSALGCIRSATCNALEMPQSLMGRGMQRCNPLVGGVRDAMCMAHWLVASCLHHRQPRSPTLCPCTTLRPKRPQCAHIRPVAMFRLGAAAKVLWRREVCSSALASHAFSMAGFPKRNHNWAIGEHCSTVVISL